MEFKRIMKSNLNEEILSKLKKQLKLREQIIGKLSVVNNNITKLTQPIEETGLAHMTTGPLRGESIKIVFDIVLYYKKYGTFTNIEGIKKFSNGEILEFLERLEKEEPSFYNLSRERYQKILTEQVEKKLNYKRRLQKVEKYLTTYSLRIDILGLSESKQTVLLNAKINTILELVWHYQKYGTYTNIQGIGGKFSDNLIQIAKIYLEEEIKVS